MNQTAGVVAAPVHLKGNQAKFLGKTKRKQWNDRDLSDLSLCLHDLQSGTQQQNITPAFALPTLSVISEGNGTLT